MKTKMQPRFLKMLSVLIVLSLLVTISSMFTIQHVSASGLVRTITRPGFLPNALALDETRNRLFVFDTSSGSVFVYDATTLEELGSVETTLEDSMSMVIDESAGKLYVGYFGPGVEVTDGIAVINTATAALIKYLPSGGYTYLVKDEAHDVVYTSSNQGIWQINVTNDVQTRIDGIEGNAYTNLAVNPVTHELFVSNWSQNDDKFFIVNPTTLALTTIPDMSGLGVAVNWTENKVYVSYCQSAGWEAVCILDRDTNVRNDVHTTNDSTEPMVFNPSVNRMYTNTEVNRITTIFNGSTDAFTNIELTGGLATVGVRHSTDNVYFVNAAGTYVMKGSTGKIVAEFPVGGDCSVCDGAIVINQSSGLVYVINDDSVGKVTVIQDGVFTLSCPVTPLAGTSTISGVLTNTDCRSPLQNGPSYWDPYFADRYSINLAAGQQVSIVVDGGESSEKVYLLNPSGNIVMEASGDYFGAARIPTSGLFTVPVSGTYVIEVTSVWSGLENGSFADSEWPYTLTLAITNDPLQTFTDVPDSHWASSFIERLYTAKITGGCGANPLQYCPEGTVTRAQMSIFLLKGIHGSSYAPLAVGSSTGFGDVPTDHWAGKWIKQLAVEKITGGCGNGNYCPDSAVTRAQMAIFLLKARHGASYTPPAVSSTGFGDVPTDHWAAKWIKQLAAEGITGGCGNGKYCPDTPVTRAQMAVFLVKTFNLP